jgi:hypothetical protein
MFPRSEILFPHKSIIGLKNLRDQKWQELVERVAGLQETHEDSLSFCLMMIKLCDCLNCELSSYKSSLGCSTCSRRVVSALKGSDNALLKRFENARQELRNYLAQMEEAEHTKAA